MPLLLNDNPNPQAVMLGKQHLRKIMLGRHIVWQRRRRQRDVRDITLESLEYYGIKLRATNHDGNLRYPMRFFRDEPPKEYDFRDNLTFIAERDFIKDFAVDVLCHDRDFIKEFEIDAYCPDSDFSKDFEIEARVPGIETEDYTQDFTVQAIQTEEYTQDFDVQAIQVGDFTKDFAVSVIRVRHIFVRVNGHRPMIAVLQPLPRLIIRHPRRKEVFTGHFTISNNGIFDYQFNINYDAPHLNVFTINIPNDPAVDRFYVHITRSGNNNVHHRVEFRPF